MQNTHFIQINQLTKMLLESFYHRHINIIYPYLHPDIRWISTPAHQFIQGYQAVCDYLASTYSHPPCRISSQECAVIGEDEHLCAAASRYCVFAAPGNGPSSFSHFYATLIWDIGNFPPKVLHLQVSALPQPPGHPFEEPLCLRGLHAETYFLRSGEIIYIEADNNCCCAHLTSSSISVCQPLSSIHKILPDYFIKIHRCYIVNRYYISELHRYYLKLYDQTILPVPEKKYNLIKKLLSSPDTAF